MAMYCSDDICHRRKLVQPQGDALVGRMIRLQLYLINVQVPAAYAFCCREKSKHLLWMSALCHEAYIVQYSGRYCYALNCLDAKESHQLLLPMHCSCRGQ